MYFHDISFFYGQEESNYNSEEYYDFEDYVEDYWEGYAYYDDYYWEPIVHNGGPVCDDYGQEECNGGEDAYDYMLGWLHADNQSPNIAREMSPVTECDTGDCYEKSTEIMLYQMWYQPKN